MSNTTDTQTDKDLVEKVLGGNVNAFSSIIKNTEGLVAQIVFKMINHSEDRKDVVQDIYLKAYKNLKSFRFASKLSTWIGQVAYNACVDYIRKKKLVLLNDFPDKDDDESETSIEKNIESDIYTKADASLFQKQLAFILRDELEKLPPVFKTLITLYHNEELSYEEITQITGLPQGTVKSYLFRARKSLKNSLLSSYKKEEL